MRTGPGLFSPPKPTAKHRSNPILGSVSRPDADDTTTNQKHRSIVKPGDSE